MFLVSYAIIFQQGKEYIVTRLSKNIVWLRVNVTQLMHYTLPKKVPLNHYYEFVQPLYHRHYTLQWEFLESLLQLCLSHTHYST